jgi:hypothetical protein
LDKATLVKIATYRAAREAVVLQNTKSEFDAVQAAVNVADAAGSSVAWLPREAVAASPQAQTPALDLQGGRYRLIFDLSRVPGTGMLNRHLSVSKRRDGRHVALDETDVQTLRRLFGFNPSAAIGPASPGSQVVHILEMVPEAEA